MTDDDEARIREHLDRQRGLPPHLVRLDDGRVVRVGGNADNADPPIADAEEADPDGR